MPNDYFQFKEFLVKQDKCAMKVCTDACLFGAWSAEKIKNSKLKIENASDVGTGTGLLSLMFAQKNSTVIVDAVEIDEATSEQAKENFDNCLWKERLHVYHNSIQHFTALIDKKYDVIICNPPFYEHDLKSDNKQRNLALHSNALSLKELIFIVQQLLADEGSLFVLLPYHRTKYFEELLLTHTLYVKEKVFIKQTPKHNYFRTIFWVHRKASVFNQTEIIIMNNENKYTDAFKELLKCFYLAM